MGRRRCFGRGRLLLCPRHWLQEGPQEECQVLPDGRGEGDEHGGQQLVSHLSDANVYMSNAAKDTQIQVQRGRGISAQGQRKEGEEVAQQVAVKKYLWPPQREERGQGEQGC